MGDESILHEDDVEEVIDERIDGVTAENVVIANAVAISGGESPTEVEHNALVTKINAILVALRNNGTIPTS